MTHDIRTRRTRAITAVAVALAVVLSAASADARAGKSSSSGSRGTRTTEQPAATSTAPGTAAPMERTTASPTRPSTPAAAPAAAPSRGMFGGGIMGGIMGGLIGAGIGAMLFGGGFFDGLGSFAGILGFILQIAIVAFLVHLAVKFFRNRRAANARPAYAGPAEPLNREDAPQQNGPQNGPMGGLRGALGGLGGGGAAAARPRVRDELNVTPADYAEFERLLAAVQTAYAAEDETAFRTLLTPEMQAYFADELAENVKRGVANRISDVRLLQGDLSESWREGSTEYATVAMRFSLVDVTVDRATGRVVEGDETRPTEAVELWTFVRGQGHPWTVSAIQQTS